MVSDRARRSIRCDRVAPVAQAALAAPARPCAVIIRNELKHSTLTGKSRYLKFFCLCLIDLKQKNEKSGEEHPRRVTFMYLFVIYL